MNFLSGIKAQWNEFSFSKAAYAVAGSAGSIGGASCAYLYAPAMIKASTISACQNQCGMFIGTAIGYLAADTAVVQAMPKVVAIASAIGAVAAVGLLVSAVTAYCFASHYKNKSDFQSECNRVAPECEQRLAAKDNTQGDQEYQDVDMEPDMQGFAVA